MLQVIGSVKFYIYTIWKLLPILKGVRRGSSERDPVDLLVCSGPRCYEHMTAVA